jgi:hypothetical protein
LTGIWNEVPGGAATDGALAASFDGSNLYLFMKGLNKRVYYNIMKPNGIWGNWNEVPGGATTDVGLRACRYLGRVYLFLRNNKSKILYNYVDGHGSWSNWKEVPGNGTTAMRLTTCVFKKLWLFHTGDNNRIYMSSMDNSETWDGWYEIPGGGSTMVPLASANYHVPFNTQNDKLYLFHRGSQDGLIYYNYMTQDQAWAAWKKVGLDTLYPPEACRFGKRLYLFSSDANTKCIYYNILESSGNNSAEKWSGWNEVSGGGRTSNLLTAGIGIPSKGNTSIYLFFTGLNKHLYYQSLEEGKNEELIC